MIKNKLKMGDSDDNMEKYKLDDFEKDQDSYDNCRLSNDNNLSGKEEKERTSEISKNSLKLVNRFTIVENKFTEDSKEMKENSNDNSKNTESQNSNNNSKIETINSKKNNNNHSITNLIEIKLITVGDVAVGKTSIVSRYIDNAIPEAYKCTITVEQRTKIIKEDEETSIKFTIWDTVGQEKFRSITRQYYNNCQGAFIVFDLTRKETFQNLKWWIDEIKNYGNKDTVIIILGNKSDLTIDRVIPPNEITNYIKDEYNYFEVSAAKGNNISLAFDKMKKLILENQKRKKQIDEKIKKNKNIKNDEEDKKAVSLDELNKDINQRNRKCC